MPEHAGVVTRGRPLQPALDALGVIQEPQARFEFLETIVPVVIIPTPTGGRAVVTRRYSGRVISLGVAAVRSNCQIFNPIDSGVLVRPRNCMVSHATSGRFLLKTTSVALTGVSTAFQGSKDFRTPGIGAAQLREQTFAFGAEPGFEKETWLWDIPATFFPTINGAFFTEGYVLTPGSGLILVGIADNVDLITSWDWDEEGTTTLTQ